MNEPATTLKRNPRRTVEVLADSARVVKRYHHPGTLARLLDGSRARQEMRLLLELERRGVPVPRAIETRRAEGGFELVTEWIEGAAPLDRMAPTTDLVRGVADALARAHVAGLAHRDLHPGNLVARPDGRTWIVDVRGARLGPGFDPATARRDLVSLASAVRERVSSSLRARFLLEYARALPREARERLPSASEIEAAARIHRREAVFRSRKRWTRLSSVCRPVLDGFANVEASDLELRDDLLVLSDRSWRRLLRAWYAAARLHEHGIPCARPWILSRSPERFAAFALPPGARPDDPGAPHRMLDSILQDRGLALEGACVRVDRAGRAWIGASTSARLVDIDAQDAAP